MRIISSKVARDLEHLQVICDNFREKGAKISFTSGVFDIIHDGHPLYLEEVRKRGDVLVVGVDNNALVRKFKGPKRPYNSEHIRVKVVAAFECVDIAIVLHDIEEMIKIVRPDVFVVSKSTKDNPLDGREREVRLLADMGSEIVILPPMSSVHSTYIIEKINVAADQLQFDFQGAY